MSDRSASRAHASGIAVRPFARRAANGMGYGRAAYDRDGAAFFLYVRHRMSGFGDSSQRWPRGDVERYPLLEQQMADARRARGCGNYQPPQGRLAKCVGAGTDSVRAAALSTMAAAAALNTRQPSLSVRCFAERRYGGVVDDEMLWRCRRRHPEGDRQHGGARQEQPALSVPQYGIQQDVRAGMASYPAHGG
jgi:hypothetical protein